GVKASLDAGMGCIAVTNDFTRKSIHESKLLEDRWIVDDRQKLLDIAQQFISEFENKIEGENDG
ncbi:MAG: hypothetical protein GWN01_03345, partial [Nitrosopumilaceae archaeon]|nr:hypothetical protein [Nitrosopumilaceae archaeon]NIX60599.1 hypothetical protein [Nitrosopumilaceae archaeon]